eukprot:5838722-Prymnesium_polylepis.3
MGVRAQAGRTVCRLVPQARRASRGRSRAQRFCMQHGVIAHVLYSWASRGRPQDARKASREARIGRHPAAGSPMTGVSTTTRRSGADCAALPTSQRVEERLYTRGVICHDRHVHPPRLGNLAVVENGGEDCRKQRPRIASVADAGDRHMQMAQRTREVGAAHVRVGERE